MQPVLSSSSLIGDSVVNPQGESLGKLEDIMIDMSSGRIEYGVLNFGGVLGMGNKLFAVPFDQFTADTGKERLVLNIDKERLKDAPGFDKDNWPNFADQSFRQEVSSYYSPRI
ncbi:PRC-barrel domain-containing protein [Parvularcula maris]|uniref:PRC-barrel domain-containing protein n=1 Tax=Parvularcula maris TaxID=2965077 RepID=A0A9X2LBL8_9PROT|nr:PRC-barrel domain-containing protein [Parvularcula maris]MCQ8186566.1 PRC-barrel domain-containing protein [Parvularcula maris]